MRKLSGFGKYSEKLKCRLYGNRSKGYLNTQKIVSAIICIIMVFTGFSVSGTGAVSSQNTNYVSLVDFSELTANKYCAYNIMGKLDSKADIFKKGIITDPSTDFGIGTGKCNVRGYYAEDIDEDGVTDALSIEPCGSAGIRFTLGLNPENVKSDVTAIAVHIDNREGNTWNDDSILPMQLTMTDTLGNQSVLLSQEDVTNPKATSYYLQLQPKNLFYNNIVTEGYTGWRGNKDGWYIFPLTAFGEGVDVSKIKTLRIETVSSSNCKMVIADVGLIGNISDFFYENTGFIIQEQSPVYATDGYIDGLDLSVLTPGAYRDTEELGWAGIIDTDSEIITKGIWVDKESEKGFNDAYRFWKLLDKTNFHGFIATDTDADGKTDRIEAIPNNNSGLYCTIGMNSGNSFEDVEALAIRIDNSDDTLWDAGAWQAIYFELIDKYGNVRKELEYDQLDGVPSWYIENSTKTVHTRTVGKNDETHPGWLPDSDGWYVISLDAFENGFDNSEIVSVRVQVQTFWGSNFCIADIGFVRNAQNFISFISTGKPYQPETGGSPTVLAKGSESVAVIAEAGYEYSIDGKIWKTSGRFDHLSLGETYELLQRSVETDYLGAGKPSKSTTITLFKEGDTDHNGAINATDLIDIRQHLLGVKTSSDIFAADATLDGIVNIIDLVKVKKSMATGEELTQEQLEQQQAEAGYKLKQSDFIRDISVQRARYQHGNAFCIDSGLTTYGISHGYTKELAEKSIAFYNLPNATYDFWNKKNQTHNVSEWGCTFFLDIPDGLGQTTGKGGFNPIPKTRYEAIDQLKNWLITSYNLKPVEFTGWEANNGHHPWFHYAVEAGATSVTCELGETISSPQTRIAFARGAAKQYGIGWGTDFSYWYNNLNLGRLENCPENKNPNYGHSDNLHERIFIISYMGGTGWFMNEDAIALNFWENRITEDGVYELTSTGKIAQKYFAFSNEHKDIGINYTPFGILMDREHGSYCGDPRITIKKVFRVFDYTPADEMNANITQLFFPDTNNVLDGLESHFLANSPYGDTCDVILQNSSQKVLNSYPCLIMSGDLSDASVAERTRYINYVKQGGTLIMNTAYLPLFPKYASQYNGNGRQTLSDENGTVIIYGDDYDISDLNGILREQLARFVPFTISGDVEYLINVKNGSLIVTVLNNKGVYKPCDAVGWIDESMTQNVSITYTSNLQLKNVTEIYEKENVSRSGNTVNTVLAPGAIRVYEFKFD